MHSLRKFADHKAQIIPMNGTDALLLLFLLFFAIISGGTDHPEQPHAQSPFLFPIVFGVRKINGVD